MYVLNLHWKQGDDLAAHLEESKSPSEALRAWAEDHLRRAAVCQEIAAALEGHEVHISADTPMIALVGETDEVDRELDKLVERGLIFLTDEGE